MAWTIESALDDPDIEVVDHTENVWTVRVGALRTPVRISLQKRKDGTVWWDQSHAMHTPTQIGPYWTSRPFDIGPDAYPYALHRAVSGLADYYREAIKAGHQPEEKWLVAD